MARSFRSVVRYLREVLLEERITRTPWINLILGCVVVVFSAPYLLKDQSLLRLVVVLGGLSPALLAAGDFVFPRNRRLAVLLRVCALSASVFLLLSLPVAITSIVRIE